MAKYIGRVTDNSNIIMENFTDPVMGKVFKVKCYCGNYYLKKQSTVYSWFKNSEHVPCCDTCTDKIKEQQYLTAKLIFNNKDLVGGEGKTHCGYCESYRNAKMFMITKGMHRYCDNCRYIQRYKIVVGDTFEELMSSWNPESHHKGTKRLPYFSGNSTKGYKLRGFTYVSSEDYAEFNKVLWIKVKDYIKTSMSKGNLERLGIPLTEYKSGVYKFLHREVLSLEPTGNEVVADHINRKTLDNRKNNLREVTVQENNINRRGTIGKTSRYKGVSYISYRDYKDGKLWRTMVEIKGIPYCSTRFSTELEAAEAYDLHIKMYDTTGKAYLNFPDK